jgi:hypothetical protein
MKLFPKKSKWIDLGYSDNCGNYYLYQMRYRLDNNKKEFRKIKIGFVNDHTQKQLIYEQIQEHNSKD